MNNLASVSSNGTKDEGAAEKQTHVRLPGKIFILYAEGYQKVKSALSEAPVVRS